MAFDLKTAVVTAVLLPLFYFILKWARELLQDRLSFLLSAISWATRRMLHRSSAAKVSRRLYCRTQLENPKTKYLPIPGWEGAPLETDDIFVPLSIHDNSAGRVRNEIMADHKFVRYTYDPATRTTSRTRINRIRIVGDPGSGKSSLVKQMYRRACREGLYSWTARSDSLPIFLELKTLEPPDTEDLGQWMLDELRAIVCAVPGFEMNAMFDGYLSRDGIALYLDGLDEVATSRYQRVKSAINQLAEVMASASPQNTIVLTMRVQFHQQVASDFSAQFPDVGYIQPFTPGDIYDFLERWPFAKASSGEVSRLFEHLTDRPSLREMCSNPLVLAMYVAGDQMGEGVTPDTRSAFYGKVVDELLVARRSRQLGVASRNLLREQRESYFGKLALQNLCNPDEPGNLVPWECAIAAVYEVYGVADDHEAELVLNELKRDTGIVTVEKEGESLRFIHLTFCEYLAAKEATEGVVDGWDSLVSTHLAFTRSEEPQIRTRLVEVIPFALALLPKSQREAALVQIRHTSDNRVIGRCILETQAYDSHLWTDYCSDESKHLVEVPPDRWDDAWLRRLQFFSAVLLDHEDWAAHMRKESAASLGALVGAIVRSERERLLKVFTSYARNDSVAAFRLATACGVDLVAEEPKLVSSNLDSPPFLGTAVERALVDHTHREDWANIFADASSRNSSVGSRLAATLAPRPWAEVAIGAPNRCRWFPIRNRYPVIVPYRSTPYRRAHRPLIDPPSGSLTLLEASWTIALQSDCGWSNAVTTYRGLPGPRAGFPRITYRAIAAGFALLAAATAQQWVASGVLTGWAIPACLTLLVLTWASVFSVRLPALQEQVYAALAGLPTFWMYRLRSAYPAPQSPRRRLISLFKPTGAAIYVVYRREVRAYISLARARSPIPE